MEYTASKTIEDELKKHGTYATNTVGVSMKPLFKTHRDAVVLKAADREMKKYDVVLYTDKIGRYILHRIIAIKEDRYVIRGDNTFVKEYVPKERVIAFMVSFNRKGRHHSTDELGYRIYSRVWNFIYPARFLFNKFLVLVRKVKRKISK